MDEVQQMAIIYTACLASIMIISIIIFLRQQRTIKTQKDTIKMLQRVITGRENDETKIRRDPPRPLN